MTFEELSAAPPDFVQWYVTVGYLDAVWCRQRADDSCEQPVMPQIAAPALPVSEPSAALMLACGLIAVALLRRPQTGGYHLGRCRDLCDLTGARL